MILCWSAKGGSGTTVVACSLALAAAQNGPTTLVDLVGDCATALGLAEPSGPGVTDWLASPTAGADDLHDLAVPIRDDATLIPQGKGEPLDDRWARLADALQGHGHVIVDAGLGPPRPELRSAASHSLLVVRPCYLALRRAQQLMVRPTGVVLVTEPGRALTSTDIEGALGVGVVAEVHYDPAVARAVDAGLLAARMPRSLLLSLRNAA
ncbi:MAG TPA: hypothetical protein VH761_09535 [Ilumatobacteraceae bacterium]